MKKLLSLSIFCSLFLFSCKKKENTVSSLVSFSTPTVTITGENYYSLGLGEALPAVQATAYDSFYHESLPAIVNQGTFDYTIPNLYVINVTARNKYGMVGSNVVYAAVTVVDPAIDLSGTYQRIDNGSLNEVHITKLKNGLYMTDNIGGVAASSSAFLSAVFAQINDSTLAMPTQPTAQGDVEGVNITLSLAPGDTIISYKVGGTGPFNPNPQRTFQKM